MSNELPGLKFCYVRCRTDSAGNKRQCTKIIEYVYVVSAEVTWIIILQIGLLPIHGDGEQRK
jgi:hypothetical protein